ncbi:hypothetical protein ACIQXZ_29475 [Bacillus thuringiensis]
MIVIVVSVENADNVSQDLKKFVAVNVFLFVVTENTGKYIIKR